MKKVYIVICERSSTCCGSPVEDEAIVCEDAFSDIAKAKERAWNWTDDIMNGYVGACEEEELWREHNEESTWFTVHTESCSYEIRIVEVNIK